jgi:acetyltransferase EpsM
MARAAPIPLVIVGCGGHALVVRDCMERRQFRLIGHIDDRMPAGSTIEGVAVLGRPEDLPALAARHPGLAGVIAIGDNARRRQVAGRVANLLPDFPWANIVHPATTIAPSVRMAGGCVIVAGAVVNGHSRLGRHVLINTGSLIDHDNRFDDYASTGPGVVTGGNVVVGALSHIGIGASVRHGIHIGQGCVIGGMAYVDRDVGDRLVCYGVPARPIRAHREGARYL